MIKRYAILTDLTSRDVRLCSEVDPILKAAREVADELLLAHGWKEYRDCDCPKCKLARQILETTEA